MKKFLAILTAISMLICFTACGGNDGDDVRGEIKDNNQTTENSEDVSEVASEETESETQKDNNKEKLSLGNSEGNVYESTFIGIGWSLPEGWEFLSQEQINEINKITADMLDSEQLEAALENATVICDMYALNYTTGSTVNIQLEKLNAMTSLLYDESKYVDATLPMISQNLEATGYTDVQAVKTLVNVAGTQHQGIDVQVTVLTATLYEKIACIKVGDYMCVITVASTSEEDINNVFGNFYALEE